MTWLFLAAVTLSCHSTSIRETPGTIFVDEARGLSVDVPPGWYAVPAQYSPHHYLDIFLTLNNQVPGFHLGSWTGPRIQVQPGMICICIGEGTLGPLADPVPSSADDHSFETAVQHLQKALAGSSSGTLQYAEVSYTRAGRAWETAVYAAVPCSAQERKQAISIIRGIRFAEVPITKPGTESRR